MMRRRTWPLAAVVVGALVLLTIGVSGEDPLEVEEVEISGDPRVLLVTYMATAPPCDVPTRVTVDESDSTVTLRAWAEAGPSGVCPAAGRLMSTEVELEEPLGDREVVDGRDGQVVVVVESSERA